ncbi:MAG: NUDIX hydrolase [Nanoarchaeota archaeon]|nr:NUDIX hydrolase [Nanoarchaeota archaeon]
MKEIKNYNCPVPTVRVILEDLEGKVLILRRAEGDFAGGEWCLPGGKVDIGQTVEQACMEEVKDETGLDVTALEFLFFADNLPVPNREGYFHTLTFYYQAEHTGELRLNDESSEAAWISEAAIPLYRPSFGNDKAIERYFALRKQKA